MSEVKLSAVVRLVVLAILLLQYLHEIRYFHHLLIVKAPHGFDAS